MIITIDGPVASGKSTAARNLARALGFEYLDTGAVYRALTLLAKAQGIDTSDRAAVARMLTTASVRLEKDRVLVDNRDVSAEIRRPDVTCAVRPIAENPDVRAFVKEYEHSFAAGKNVVVEGRDMGTVVFPDADVKIYLTASTEERAKRRYGELKTRGILQDYSTVLAELVARDEADMNRHIAPLRKALEAIVVDTTGLVEEETLRKLQEAVRKAAKGS